MNPRVRAHYDVRENELRSETVIGSAEELFGPGSRRKFLKMLGVGGTVVLLPSLFTSCRTVSMAGIGGLDAVTIDLRSDIGLFNFTYALEQLEGAFYTAAVASAAFGGMSADQKEVLIDIRNAEVVHREFLKAVLGSNAIGTLKINEGALNSALSSTASIFRAAEHFEETGVSTLNGAGKYLTSAANLGVAGKIVSVEARHAAAIRDVREAMGITGGAAAGTRFAGDDIVVSSGAYAGLDAKIEAPMTLQRVGVTGIPATVITPILPSPKPGTPDFPPPLPTP